MKVSDVLGSDTVPGVRSRLRDVTAGSYDWSDLVLTGYMADAQDALRQRIPELGRTDAGAIAPAWTPPATVNDDLSVGIEYRTHLIHYVCACAFEEEADDKRHQAMAAYHRNEFEKLLAPQEE